LIGRVLVRGLGDNGHDIAGLQVMVCHPDAFTVDEYVAPIHEVFGAIAGEFQLSGYKLLQGLAVGGCD
jgi:hypothetical protein